ncbi:unnamed protein product [Arabidopsis lyrata]|nr:unnamed protein product [Arabidopsis lyrata]
MPRSWTCRKFVEFAGIINKSCGFGDGFVTWSVMAENDVVVLGYEIDLKDFLLRLDARGVNDF